MISDLELRGLSHRERAELAQRLAALAPPVPQGRTVVEERTRRWFVIVVGVASVLLIPWIVALAATLPRHYLTGHWRATWVGFDLAVAVALATTAWAALRRRQVVVLAAFVSATLLGCDAWFDIMTASGPDRWASVATGVLVELPLAGWLFFVAHHLVRLSMRRLLVLSGQPPDLPLRRMPLFGVPPRQRR
ncbi:hypothetical protein Drose_20950 [Dactylosporangium roseum]|uniref:DUF2637 domain-containing protein n=1 Tax=Dactylosporangium roseum TaxID=47989 RepID=A0ABY5YVI3_9ACTN|nr:hypothetical protein [Dactylosporangium roseum]UWZ33755.1 hypothetical protein Drose_20950 [Dactylosporangium roseum]